MDTKTMDMNKAIATESNWLKKEDVTMDGVLVTILGVKMEDIGGETKPVLYFDGGFYKPMVVNKTNGTLLIGLFGGESNAWSGRQIVVFHNPHVQFQGVTVGGLAVKPAMTDPAGPAIAQAALQSPSAPDVPPSPPVDSYAADQVATAQTMANYPNDDVPF
jgi:hypothetical protein